MIIIRKCIRHGLLHWRPHSQTVNTNGQSGFNDKIFLCKYLKISKSKAQYLSLKNPVINKLDEVQVKTLLDTVRDLGYNEDVLLQEPLLFSLLPTTLKYRYRVLEECGVTGIKPLHLLSYLTIIKQRTIKELKQIGEISKNINIENRLASYMTQWPTSLTTLIHGNVDESTLYSLRIKIIQRYLELVLDIGHEEFLRGLRIYPTIKHRPLSTINETLTILQSQLLMPAHKIKNNMYLIHADPDNLKNIIYKFRSIGGIDIKEIMKMYPKIASKNYSTLLKIRQILDEYNISNEAQKRCFDIYTLGPETIRERLEKAKSIPEFQTLTNHPRYLKLIHYNKTAMKRLMTLYDNNKKCLSLNVLSGSSAHYDIFEKAPGDRFGKGKDLVFCVTEVLGKPYNMHDVRRALKRHPFWINVPLFQVKYVYQMLYNEFSAEEIYCNCPILLYPWNKIRDHLQYFKTYEKPTEKRQFQDHVVLKKLNNSQKLSLVLYLLEKHHYFTGNGVWIEDKTKIEENVHQDTINK